MWTCVCCVLCNCHHVCVADWWECATVGVGLTFALKGRWRRCGAGVRVLRHCQRDWRCCLSVHPLSGFPGMSTCRFFKHVCVYPISLSAWKQVPTIRNDCWATESYSLPTMLMNDRVVWADRPNPAGGLSSDRVTDEPAANPLMGTLEEPWFYWGIWLPVTSSAQDVNTSHQEFSRSSFFTVTL